ncbi:MAG: VanZ family protein [Ignavibacteria bacterium]
MKINSKYYYLALAAYCAFIFIISSIPGQELPKVDFEFSDKIAHFIVYAVLFILFFYSLKNQTKSTKLQKYSLEFALLFTMIYGATDELHQYFVPNRSCELFDWFADTLGALIVYSSFKIYHLKNKTLVTMLIFLTCFIIFGTISGCSSTKEIKEPAVSIIEEEAWLDLMPVISVNDDPLGFLIGVNFETANSADVYEIKDLKIYFDNDTATGKKFQTEKIKQDNGRQRINLFQLNEENYLNNNNKVLPQKAQFIFDLYKNNSKFKTLKTSNLTIKKVY